VDDPSVFPGNILYRFLDKLTLRPGQSHRFSRHPRSRRFFALRIALGNRLLVRIVTAIYEGFSRIRCRDPYVPQVMW
jgi:hypothetical protein